MKNKFNYITIFLTIWLFTSCNNSQEKQTVDKADSIAAAMPTITTNMNNATDIAKSIDELLEENNKVELLGKDISIIKDFETGAKSDSSNTFQTFSHYFNESETEFVDVQYNHNGNKIEKVVLDVYIDKAESVQKIIDAETAILTKKLGKANEINGAKVFKTQVGSQVSIKNVSVPNSSGLQIEIYK